MAALSLVRVNHLSAQVGQLIGGQIFDTARKQRRSPNETWDAVAAVLGLALRFVLRKARFAGEEQDIVSLA